MHRNLSAGQFKNALVSIWLNNLWFTGQADEGRRTTPQPTKLGQVYCKKNKKQF
jgi:hypothetical protein